ncbi:MAG: alkaline phosphatase family protein, partial [Candidatus Yanofskybacteria bacterium]|nr:alkaline phosphatase family protein [Candidatus Yanofskybacteria bacterium]
MSRDPVQIRRDRKEREFVYPSYGKCSLAEVPSTILSLFGANPKRACLPVEFWKEQAQGSSKVVVFFIDGLGYHQFSRYAKQYSFFERIQERGEVFPITTVFPSTTAAGLTTMHTGLTPQEHGLPEWVVYFEEFGQVILTLPFTSLVEWEETDSLLKQGGTPDMLYTGSTIYEQLQEEGVKSFVFIPKAYAESAYSQATQKGSKCVPYQQASDLAIQLREKIKEEQGPAYFFVYWPEIDSAGHAYGPEAPETSAAASLFSHILEEELFGKLSSQEAKDTLV